MPPLAIAFAVVGFLCGAAALIKSVRSRELPAEHAKVPLMLGNLGMLLIVAAGAVFYLDNQSR